MVTKYNTMIRDGQKNTSANTYAKYNHAAAEYIHPATKYIRPTTSDCNYILGCFDLQWQTTSDARVYLLVQ